MLIKTQMGLGVLGIPVAFDALGLVPGVVCLCAIAAVTTWSNYTVGDFKRKHPEVYGIGDAGQLIFGWWGNLYLATAFVLCKFGLKYYRWMPSLTCDPT